MKAIRREVLALKAYHLQEPPSSVKINQNESPWDWPRELKERLLSELVSLPFHRYPPYRESLLAEPLARRFGLAPESVLVGNGSNELLQALFLACLGPRRRVLIPAPTFSLYRQLALLCHGRTVEVPLGEGYTYEVNALLEADRRERPSVLLLCSPNNPTGSLLRQEEILRLCEATSALVAVDEAYGEFVSGEGAAALLSGGPRNLVVLRTFSKAYGSAALRLGYLLASPPVAKEISKALLPYGVSPLTAALGEAILGEDALIQERVLRLRALRAELFGALQAFEGLRVFPSGGNFLLVRLGPRAREVYLGLKERGILVRDLSSSPRLKGCLRFTVGSKEENAALLAALREVWP